MALGGPWLANALSAGPACLHGADRGDHIRYEIGQQQFAPIRSLAVRNLRSLVDDVEQRPGNQRDSRCRSDDGAISRQQQPIFHNLTKFIRRPPILIARQSLRVIPTSRERPMPGSAGMVPEKPGG